MDVSIFDYNYFLLPILPISAKKNLEHRPKVDELKEELKLKYQELETLKSKVDGKIALQSEKMEGRSLPHLQVGKKRRAGWG